VRDPKTKRFRAAHDPGDLLGVARAVLRYAAAEAIGCSTKEVHDAEVVDVSQSAFDRSRAGAGYPEAPSARELCRQTGLSWAKAKEHVAEGRNPALALAQAKVRKRDRRHRSEDVVPGLRAVARRLGIAPSNALAEEQLEEKQAGERPEQEHTPETPEAEQPTQAEARGTAAANPEQREDEAGPERADARDDGDGDGERCDHPGGDRRADDGGDVAATNASANDDVVVATWMSTSVYRVMRKRMQREDRRRRHGGALFLPSVNQITEAAGSWRAALELAGLPTPNWRSGNRGLSVAEALDLCFEQHRVLPSQRELLRTWRAAQDLPISRQSRSWEEELVAFRSRWQATGVTVPASLPPKDQRPDYTLKHPNLPDLPGTHVRKRRRSESELVDCVVVYLEDLSPGESARASGYRHWADQRPDQPSIGTLTRRSSWSKILTEARERLRERRDQRRRPIEDGAWNDIFLPDLRHAARVIRDQGHDLVLLDGDFRLPTAFTVGRILNERSNVQLSIPLGREEWSSDAVIAEKVQLRTEQVEIDEASGLAVAVSIAGDIAADVEAYLREEAPGLAGKLIAVHPESGPGRHSVAGPGEARAIAETIVDEVRSAVGDEEVHLFLSCPRPLAVFLGRVWNRVPSGWVYADLNPGYAQSFHIEMNPADRS